MFNMFIAHGAFQIKIDPGGCQVRHKYEDK